MSLLSLIPLSYRLAGAAAAVAAVALGVWGYGSHRFAASHQAGYAVGHAEFTGLQAEMSARALAGEKAAREEETRRKLAQAAIEEAHEKELERVRADAVIADAAAGRLQRRVAELVAAARSGDRAGNPSAVQGGPPADDAAGVLAELQRRADERASVLARIADERGAAGAACEREYDALTAFPANPPPP